MKIVVSHFGRQYCHELLKALVEKNYLSRFYTALAGEKIQWLSRLPKLGPALRKREFAGISSQKIVHYPVLFAGEQLLRRRLPNLGQNLIIFFDRLVARKIRQCPCDLIISYENANLNTFKIAKQSGKITVLDLAQIHHSDIAAYAAGFMSPQKLREEIEVVNPRKAAALEYTDYVITLSSFAAESMLRHGWPQDRLFTVHLGIDPQRFFLKKKYAQPGKLKLLFVGTMTRRKGLEVLFQAIDQLPPESVELTLIGPPADAVDLLQAHAHQHTYLPFLHHEALVGHYQEADLFVFPSLLDSWAQTVLEAMACGTPAIVTENTGAKDAVKKGGGWVVPANDAVALANCIQHCINHPETLETTGREAHRIAQNYTWEQYHRQINSILGEIAGRENIPI